MALQNSFDSKVNREFRLTTVLLEIKKSHLVNTPHSEGSDIIFVTDADTEVSSFQHPIYDADADVVYLDVRGYSILDRNGAFRLKGDLDSDLLLLRGKLELAWMHATANDLFTALGYSNEVFVRWLSETITQQFSLNPAQDTQLKVLIALYNIGQYYNNITEPALITRYYRLISQQYYIDMQTVEEIASRLTQTFPRDLSEFIAAIKEANISTRLSGLNEVSMYNMLGGAWFFTANPGAVVGLALEYPPAFAAMVAMAVNFRVFKKTKIGGVVERMSRRDAHTNYIRALKHLFDRTVGEPKPGKYKGGYGLEQFPINAMAVPDFTNLGVGAEAVNWERVLTAAAGGALAGIVVFGIVKFIEWVTGFKMSASQVDRSHEAEKIVSESEQLIQKARESIKAAHSAQVKIGQTNSAEFERVLKKMSKDKKAGGDNKPEVKVDESPTQDDDVSLTSDEREVFEHRKTICNHFRGDDQIAALAIFNELCIDHSFGNAGKHTIKELAERLIEIDKKTSLFKDGNYTFCMMLAGKWMRLQSLFTLSLATRDGVVELGKAVDDFEKAWGDIITGVELSVNAIESEGEACIPKLEEFTKQIEQKNEELRKYEKEFNRQFEKDMDIADVDDAWKSLMNEKPLEAIRNIKDIRTKFVTNKKLYQYLDRYQACVKGREGKVKSIVDAAAKIENSSGKLKVAATSLSSAVGRTLTAMASSFRFINNACRSYDMVMSNYLDAAAGISHGIEKLRKTYEKEAKEK